MARRPNPEIQAGITPSKKPRRRPAPEVTQGVARPTQQVVGKPRGLVRPGNIDLSRRPVVRNPDGSISTVRSISISQGRHTVLIPTVIGRRVVSNERAIAHYNRTQQHLGVFDSVAAADKYAQGLHEAQAQDYGHPASKVPISRAEMAHIKAITSGVGRDIASAAIARGESVTSRALARVAAAPTHRPSLLDQALAPLAHDVARTADLGSGLLDVAKKGPDATQRLADYFNRPTPKGTETGSDAVLGKAATNLLFHGDTSHPYAAGAEIATMFPLFRGARLGARAVVEGSGHLVPAAKKAVSVADVLGPAGKVRAEQTKLASAERARRFGKAETAFGQGGGGQAGLHAVKGELRGELPKVAFTKLREGGFTQSDLDNAINHIYEHPDLKPGEKLSASQGLLDAFKHDRVLQPRQLDHLATVFGPEQAKEIARLSKTKKLGRLGLDVVGIPRTLMSTLDMSNPFRQSLVAGGRHPVIFAKNFKTMVKTFGSQRVYDATMQEIKSHPLFQKATDAGMAFTEVLGEPGVREEAFPSQIAVRVPGIKNSSRSFTAMADLMRMHMFAEQYRLAAKAGVDVENFKELKSIAKLVNAATGRGHLGPLESWAPAANAVFFSPRLIAARVNMLNPLWYAKLTPFARRQAIRSMVQLGTAVSAILAPAAYFGYAKVGSDPRSADFAKLKLGNTRADLLGGFQQYIKFGAQMTPEKLYGGKTWAGKSISSATGEISSTGPGPFQRNRWDMFTHFLEGKASPPLGMGIDLFRGTDFAGQPISVQKEVLSHTLPLVAQDAYELYKDTNSVKLALLGYGISGFGIGMQTYANPNPKKQAAKFKAWKGQAEKDWAAIHPGLPLPMNVVRAKRDSDAIAAAAAQFPNASVPENKRTPAQAQEHDHAQLTFLVDYLLKTHPDLEQYRSSYDALLSSSPLAIHAAIPKIHHGIMGGAWDNYLAQVNAYHKRKTYGNG